MTTTTDPQPFDRAAWLDSLKVGDEVWQCWRSYLIGDKYGAKLVTVTKRTPNTITANRFRYDADGRQATYTLVANDQKAIAEWNARVLNSRRAKQIAYNLSDATPAQLTAIEAILAQKETDNA